MGPRGGQSSVRCGWAAGEAEGEGGGCLRDAAEGEGGDEGCVAVGEAAVGGWRVRVGGGSHPAWGSARRQEVRDGVRSPGSPGCRSSRPPPWSHLLHPCPPSEGEDGDLDEVRHDGGQ